MLKAIERLTGQRITLEKLPTVTDLRARRLELTRTALQASLETDDLERFRVVLDSLTDEFDVENIALAAVKLLHEAAGGDVEQEEEIPSPAPASGSRSPQNRESRPGSGGRERSPHPRASDANVTRLFFGIGRRAGLRPQDLVGAIAGESGLSAREIGAIQITDRFSLVEVPEPAADMVIAAMQRSTIRGRRPTVRRERFVR
jgi:ATP-dependent RNA helicase DeaD